MDFKISKGRYKSLSAPFEWLNIPQLAVLTGLNGSGKTQLLELIRMTIINIGEVTRLGLQVTISGVQYKNWEVAYTHSLWHLSDPQPNSHDDIATRVLQDAQILEAASKGQIASSDPKTQERAERLMRRVQTYADSSQIGKMDFAKRMQLASAEYVLDSNAWEIPSLPQQIQRIFWEYYLISANQKINPSSTFASRSDNMTPPWESVNELLNDFGLPYRVNHPGSLMTKYRLALNEPKNELSVDFSSLSSGEKVLISLAFWLYTFSKHGVLPRLVLLDEPDAHLHPSMTKVFVDVIRDVLVSKHNCRVIMTTHRPDTIVFSPKDAIFEIKRSGEGPQLSTRMHAVGRISNDLLMAMPSARLVMVEDEIDEKFYQTVLSKMIELGKLSGSVLAVFLRMSSGKGPRKQPGGKSLVKARVQRLQDEGILNVSGIIDRDQGEEGSEAVHVIARYCIENYIYDPIQVFAALLSVRKEPNIVLAHPLARGNEHKLRELPAHDLQNIVNIITESIKSRLTDLTDTDQEQVNVEMTNGTSISYPKWHLQRNGKILMAHYRELYNTDALQDDLMLSMLARVGLFSVDLVDLFLKLLHPATR